jgi:hypothetical protein
MEDLPIVIFSPESFGRRIGIEDNGRRVFCGGEENPNVDDGSGVKYACLALSHVSSKSLSEDQTKSREYPKKIATFSCYLRRIDFFFRDPAVTDGNNRILKLVTLVMKGVEETEEEEVCSP